MKRSRTFLIAVGILFVAIISSPYWVHYFQKKKSPLAKDPAFIARVIPLTAAGTIVHNAHPAWDNASCNSVGEKKLRIGMRKEMVEAAWGRPRTIVWRSDARDKEVAIEILSTKEEEWIMDEGPYPRRAIFRNLMGHNAPDNNAKLFFFQDSIAYRVLR